MKLELIASLLLPSPGFTALPASRPILAAPGSLPPNEWGQFQTPVKTADLDLRKFAKSGWMAPKSPSRMLQGQPRHAPARQCYLWTYQNTNG